MGKTYSGGTPLSTGFKLNDPQPPVDYMVVDLISDLTNTVILPNQFIGMTTFVLEDQNVYVKKSTGWAVQTGFNIANANLAFAASRTHNLGGNKVTFTNGRFCVPALELEATTANSVPTKFWLDSLKAYFTNSLGINSALISDSALASDKTGQDAFSKVMVLHPTTKEQVVRDFADPFATTLAVQNASTAQKAAMRVALLGAAVPASPVVNLVNTWYIRRGTEKMLFISGVNLTPLDPVSIWIEFGATKVFATNYFSISPSALQTFWNIPIDFPTGDYFVKLTFGAVVQGASPGVIRVLENGASLIYNFTTTDFKLGLRAGGTISPSLPSAILSNNIFRISKRSTTYAITDDSLDSAIKTSNIFQGALGASWEIIMSITTVNANTGFSNSHIGMALTETTDAGFTTVESLIFNHVLLQGASRQGYNNLDGGATYNPNTSPAGFTNSVIIRKAGNKVATYGFNPTTGLVNSYYETIIDTSKTYALVVLEAATSAVNLAKEITISATILNP